MSLSKLQDTTPLAMTTPFPHPRWAQYWHYEATHERILPHQDRLLGLYNAGDARPVDVNGPPGKTFLYQVLKVL